MRDSREKTYLGLDYGERRVGIARSDPTGLIASPVTTLEVTSQKKLLDQLQVLIAEVNPMGIVIGYPLMPSGDLSDKCREIDAFIKKLAEVYDGLVIRQDERYSSSEAVGIIHAHGKKAGKKKKRIDRIAAVIILQRYLDEQGAGKS
jgi:putative Holliday junction resolvase